MKNRPYIIALISLILLLLSWVGFIIYNQQAGQKNNEIRKELEETQYFLEQYEQFVEQMNRITDEQDDMIDELMMELDSCWGIQR